MADVIDLFGSAADGFHSRVAAVRNDHWTLPTPCADWNVRQLINHLAYEDRWAVPLLEGKTPEEVGDRFEGDLLGDDPHKAWADAVSAASASVARPGVTDKTVHVSFGQISGTEYLSQLITDHLIHTWDLARAISADETLDPDVVAFAYGYLAPQIEGWRSAGAFGPAVEPPPNADRQTQLLALSGRSV